jgi:hypothetical protein
VKKLTGAKSRSILTIASGIDDLSHEDDPLSILTQINNHFSSITNSKSSLNTQIPTYLPSQLPPINVNEIDVYKALKRLDSSKSNSPQAVPSRILKECAMELCYVISHLLNSSFESGEIPTSWKDGFITALPKVPSVTSLSQLRPITVTSNLAKIAEKFIYDDIYDKIASQIHPQQFGVLKKSSTAHYMIQLYDFLLKSIDKKPNPVVLSLIDCEKAYDLINHSILLQELIKIGINGNSTRWIHSFLSNRKNCTRENGIYSSFQPMSRGCPQGTLLGAICFIVTFNPLLKRLSDIGPVDTRIFGYVDDLTSIEVVRGEPLTTSILQVASQSTKELDMRINAKKTLTLTIDTRQKPTNNVIKLDSIPVPQVHTVKLLGIFINNKLTWDDHVTYITTKAAGRLNYLRKLKSLGFQKQELVIAFCSFIRPVLEYNSTVWGPGLTIEQDKSIEKIQRRAIHIIFNEKISSENYNIKLQSVNLVPLSKRRQDALIRLGKSILQNPRFRPMLPEYNKNTRSLRQQNLLIPPPALKKRYHCSSIPKIVDLINKEHQNNKYKI